MDSAEAERVSEVLRTQEVRLVCQEEFQTAMAAHMGQLSAQLQDLLGQVTWPGPAAPPPTTNAPPAPPTSISGASYKLGPPAQYTGEPGLCRVFLIDCSIHFELTPHAFPTDRSKIAFMILHLGGRAKAWASAEWGRGSSICNSLRDFQSALTKTFHPVSTNREKAEELSNLRQGSRSVCDYGIRFCTLAGESGWNAAALYDVFMKGLAAPIQDLLVPLDLPSDVDSLITLAIRTDNRLSQLRRQRGGRPTATERHTTHIGRANSSSSATRADSSHPRRTREGAHAAGERSTDA